MLCLFFFFKQKTAYELRISDWSSDVCSSDLLYGHQPTLGTSDAAAAFGRRTPASRPSSCRMPLASTSIERCILARPCPDRDAAALAQQPQQDAERLADRKSTRLNSSHSCASRMQYSARKKKPNHYYVS